MMNEMNKMMENELENVAGGALGDRYYVVLPGDTLSAIAVKHRTTVEKLKAVCYEYDLTISQLTEKLYNALLKDIESEKEA